MSSIIPKLAAFICRKLCAATNLVIVFYQMCTTQFKLLEG
jgi:hypothetical protein